MTLEQIKKRLLEDKKHYTEMLKSTEEDILIHEKIKPITNKELFLELSNIEDLKDIETKGLSINFKGENYENILGGDGRSRPWSEKKIGKVCYFNSSYFLEISQKEIIMQYIKTIGEVNVFKFKYKL